MKKSEMYCGYCGHTDNMILTSMPPKVKCLITAECHNLGADCNVEVAFVKYGLWIPVTNGATKNIYICNQCGRKIEDDGIPALILQRYPYCHCGAKMQGVKE